MQQRLAAVGEMAAGIAHEIRNPLASMSGSIQILRQELPLTDEQSQLMDIVLRESDRLNETIRSFLAYARPQRLSTTRGWTCGRSSPTPRRCCRTTPSCSDAHQIAIDVPDEPVWYEADEDQIRQIVWNLATNGLRAMPNGGALRLSVACARRTSDAAPARSSSASRTRASASRRRSSTASSSRSAAAFERGTGLGLAIVQRIVSDYGGEVQVTSQRGVARTVDGHAAARPDAETAARTPATC